MGKKSQTVWMGLATGLGAAAAVFVTRRLIDWRRQKDYDQRRLERALRRFETSGSTPGAGADLEREFTSYPASDPLGLRDMPPARAEERLPGEAELEQARLMGDSPMKSAPYMSGETEAPEGGSWHNPVQHGNDKSLDREDIENTPRLPRQGGQIAEERAGEPYLPADQPDVNPVAQSVGRDATPIPQEATRPAEPGMPTGFPAIQRSTREAYTDNERELRGTNTPGEADDRADMEEEGEGNLEAAIPMTGTSVQAATTWGVVPDAEDLQIDDGVDPLVHYLMSLHRMVEILRERRRESGEQFAGMGSSLVPADRAEYQAVVNRLEHRLADYGEDSLIAEDRQGRLYRLTIKIRDALENLDYTDDDIFRIYGEVRSEACQLVLDAEGFDEVRSVYECSDSSRI